MIIRVTWKIENKNLRRTLLKEASSGLAGGCAITVVGPLSPLVIFIITFFPLSPNSYYTHFSTESNHNCDQWSIEWRNDRGKIRKERKKTEKKERYWDYSRGSHEPKYPLTKVPFPWYRQHEYDNQPDKASILFGSISRTFLARFISSTPVRLLPLTPFSCDYSCRLFLLESFLL